MQGEAWVSSHEVVQCIDIKFYGMDQSEFGMMLSSELGIVSLIWNGFSTIWISVKKF